MMKCPPILIQRVKAVPITIAKEDGNAPVVDEISFEKNNDTGNSEFGGSARTGRTMGPKSRAALVSLTLKKEVVPN